MIHAHSMIPYRLFLRVLATAIGLLALPCSAQQEETYALQFMTFPVPMEPLKVEMLVGEGQTMELHVPGNELGPTVRVPRMTSFVFGETVLNAEQKPEFKVYGKGKPGTDPKQLVLLLRKGKDMASGFEVRFVSSDSQAFDGGKVLFINAAKTNIGGKAGGVKFSLKPGAHEILKPGLEQNGRLSHVEFFYNKEGKAVPFFSTMWPVSKHFRSVVFFYQDPINADKIQLHTFRHFLEE